MLADGGAEPTATSAPPLRRPASRERAPSFYFIDLQPGEMARFDAVLAAQKTVGQIRALPSLRTRVVAVDGVPVGAGARLTATTRWALRGDRGLTYRRATAAGHARGGRALVAGRL